jgi:hypothetical protein
MQQVGVSGQCHAPAELYPQERTSGINWIGGWLGLRDGLDTEPREQILCLCLGWNPGRPDTILSELRQLLSRK